MAPAELYTIGTPSPCYLTVYSDRATSPCSSPTVFPSNLFSAPAKFTTHENHIDLGSCIDKSGWTVRLSTLVTCECGLIAVLTVVFHTARSDLKFSFSFVLNATHIKETTDRNTCSDSYLYLWHILAWR